MTETNFTYRPVQGLARLISQDLLLLLLAAHFDKIKGSIFKSDTGRVIFQPPTKFTGWLYLIDNNANSHFSKQIKASPYSNKDWTQANLTDLEQILWLMVAFVKKN